jgi:hypothetical protein
MVGDELLDLAEVLAAGGREPRCLGRGGRHAGQLAHGGERKLAAREGRGELGEGAEGTRDPQPVLGCARRIAQRALEVVENRRHTERPPDLQRLGLPQPAGLGGVERGAALPDRPQRTIDGAPIWPGGLADARAPT